MSPAWTYALAKSFVRPRRRTTTELSTKLHASRIHLLVAFCALDSPHVLEYRLPLIANGECSRATRLHLRH